MIDFQFEFHHADRNVHYYLFRTTPSLSLVETSQIAMGKIYPRGDIFACGYSLLSHIKISRMKLH